MSKRVIGIDLGSGFSCVAIIENGKAVVVTNSEGSRTTPSVIGLKNGERKVGESAKRQRVVNPKQTVSYIKRFMGATYDNCKNTIDKVSYDVINKDGKPRIIIEEKEYSPEELSSFILTKLKKTAEDYAGEEITDAVITVPAWFGQEERESTKLAGELAGLNVLRIINEPTAAILAANIDIKSGDKKVLVADVGNGTTDFSVIEVSEGVCEVLASRGDVFLGGADFDNAIADWLISDFKNEYGVDLSQDVQSLQRILEASEKAKIELSSAMSSEINLPYITSVDGQPKHLVKSLNRAKFESLTSGLVNRIIKCGKDAVSAASVSNSDIDIVLLVGGQNRSLNIQEALKKEFGRELTKTANLDEVVAEGACLQANIIVGGDGSNDMVLLDVTPLSMGIETMGGVMTKLVEANTTIPCRKNQIFTTGADNQPEVSINVLQGERSMAKDNKTIGMFQLVDILPARRGVPQIEVQFDIDANGIITVSAKDKGTGKEQSIKIESKNSLSSDEIERIKQEAREHEVEDKKLKEEADIVNEGDSMVFQTEKQIEELGDKITAEGKKSLEEIIESLKVSLKDKNISDIKSNTDKVNKEWQKISSDMYSKTSGDGAPDFEEMLKNASQGANTSSKNESDNITDAEFEEVK